MITPDDFDALAERALVALPAELTQNLDNLVIVIEDEPPDGSETLGLYEGTALTERDATSYGLGQQPDQVMLFSGPLSRNCRNAEELYDEIIITLVHELGHFHGIDEQRLHELGWG